MYLLRYLLFPLSILYAIVAQMRMLAFDWGILKSTTFQQKTISIGNLRVGGTGKTPLTYFIIQLFEKEFQIAMLSRGYGRKTKGFLEVTNHHTVEQVGDEVYMLRQSIPNKVLMAVAESRVEGARKILQLHPNIELFVLDDAYQHRYIHRDCNILITAYQELFTDDFYMPYGRLREWRTGAQRANIVVVSKCPKTFSKDEVAKKIRPYLKKETPIFYTSISYRQAIDYRGQALNIQAIKQCVVVTGIGQSKPLLDYISEQSNVIQHFDFKDHFVYQKDTIDRIEKFARINQIETIVTTEKDWVKIKPLIQNSSMKWAYLPIEIHFNGEENLFKETILRTFVS